MREPSVAHRWRVIVVTLLYAALGIWYSVRVPVGEGVDEGAHFAYVTFIRDHHRLPTISAAGKSGVAMAHHPPLYYALGALVIAPFDLSDAQDVLQPNPHFVWHENNGSNGWNVVLHYGQDAWPWRRTALALHTLRLLSILLGAVTVVSCYELARILLPTHPWAPLGAAALVAFNPSFVYSSSTVHHDPLIISLFGLGILMAARTALQGPRRNGAVLAGVLVGGAILTKATGLLLLPIMLVGYALYACRSKTWRALLSQSAIIVLTGLGIAGWWFVRNMYLYGDPLGWSAFREAFWFNFRDTPYSWGLFWHEFVAQLGRTFWGSFGFMHMTFPRTGRYLWIATGLAVMGILLQAICMVRRRLVTPTWPGWVVALLAVGLVACAMVQFSVTSKGAGHARYLFPAIGGLVCVLIAGYNALFSWRAQAAISVVIATSLAGYAVWLPQSQVWPRYAPPLEATLTELSAASRLDLDFGGARLTGYSVHPSIAVPGTWLELSLYWQATGEARTRTDAYAHVALLDESGQLLDERSFWPAASSSPRAWRPDQTIVSRTPLHVPSTLGSASVRLEIGVSDGRRGPGLAVSAPNGQPAEPGPHLIATLPCPGNILAVSRESVQHPRDEVFGESIVLAGYTLSGAELEPGKALVVGIYWDVLSPPSADLTVFVHLVDQSGRLIAQYDSPPAGGRSPTSSWETGQLWLDSYPVLLPDTLPPGNYEIQVGLYSWPSMERETVHLNGAVSDSVTLQTIVVR